MVYGLSIAPNMNLEDGKWRIGAFSDSEFGGNPDDRISIGGRIIFFQDIPIVWCLRAMRNTTLSSAEVEIHMIFIWV